MGRLREGPGRAPPAVVRLRRAAAASRRRCRVAGPRRRPVLLPGGRPGVQPLQGALVPPRRPRNGYRTNSSSADEQAILALLASLEAFYEPRTRRSTACAGCACSTAGPAARRVPPQRRGGARPHHRRRARPGGAHLHPRRAGADRHRPPPKARRASATPPCASAGRRPCCARPARPGHGMRTLQAAVDACAGDGGAIDQAGLQERHLGPALQAAGTRLHGRRRLPRRPGAKSRAPTSTPTPWRPPARGRSALPWVACDVRGSTP